MLDDSEISGNADFAAVAEIDMSALAECLRVHGGMDAALSCLHQAGLVEAYRRISRTPVSEPSCGSPE